MSQELFLENGHLSDAGLAALRDGQLDELARLEAAEHLSFCDACLDRYLALADAADHLLDALHPTFDQPSGAADTPADSVKGE